LAEEFLLPAGGGGGVRLAGPVGGGEFGLGQLGPADGHVPGVAVAGVVERPERRGGDRHDAEHHHHRPRRPVHVADSFAGRRTTPPLNGEGLRSPAAAPPSFPGKGAGGLGHTLYFSPAPPRVLSGLTMSPTLGSSSGRSRPTGLPLAGLNRATAFFAYTLMTTTVPRCLPPLSSR